MHGRHHRRERCLDWNELFSISKTVCAVCGRDGSVAQSVVPEYDFRIPYALETHGVTTSRLRTEPTAAELTPDRWGQQGEASRLCAGVFGLLQTSDAVRDASLSGIRT